MGWGVRGGEEEDREGDGEKEWTPRSSSPSCLLRIAPFHGLVTGPNAFPELLQVPCFTESKIPLIISYIIT